MTTAGPWSVKGIDPKAREIAKDLARRSGLTLGEWLNQMISETAETPAQKSAYAYADSPAAREWAEPPPRPGRADAAQALSADSFRSRLREAGLAPEGAAATPRIAQALADLTARVEAAEHRSTLAISGIDQQTMGVLSRIEGVEREHTGIAARLDGDLEDVRHTQTQLAERLRRMGDDDGPRVEAMKALEGALAKVATQIYEGESRVRAQNAEVRGDLAGLARRMDRVEADEREAVDTSTLEDAVARLGQRMDEAQTRTSAAVHGLETSFAGLDARFGERVSAGEKHFERLAADLNGRMEAARAEMSDRLRAVAGGKLDHMEKSLRELTGKVGEDERRSADAIDRLGREVVRIAQGLGGRMDAADRRHQVDAEATEAEVARLSASVEGRLKRADEAQAESLEKLGGEIARIAEKLAERIAASERRAATELSRGLDEMGDKLGRTAASLGQRHELAAGEIAERIRASEERTTRLLDEARARLDQRKAEPLALAAEPTTPEPPIEAEPEAEAETPSFHIEDLDQPSHALFADASFLDDPFEPFDSATATSDRTEYPFAPETTDELINDPFGPIPAADDVFETASVFEAEPERPRSTRDLIEQARAAARANAEARTRRGRGPAEAPMAVPAPGFEAAVAAPAPRGPFGLPPLLRKKREGATLRTMLFASGVAATISMAATGVVLLNASEGGGEHAHGADAPTAAPAPAVQTAALAPTATPPAETLALATTTPGEPPAEIAAPAPTPALKQPLKTEVTPPPPPAPASAKLLYSAAVRAIEGGDNTGVETLKRAANLGHAPAQFYLAHLYQDGRAGLPKDAGEARRWTERAAKAGDTHAMFSLGILLTNPATPGADDKTAVEWFRKAADKGLKDAQYNLAVMHQSGRGVSVSPAEAYKWYLIAASEGDGEARTAADALKPTLTADARVVAERSAAAYRSQTAAAQVRTAAAN